MHFKPIIPPFSEGEFEGILKLMVLYHGSLPRKVMPKDFTLQNLTWPLAGQCLFLSFSHGAGDDLYDRIRLFQYGITVKPQYVKADTCHVSVMFAVLFSVFIC